MLNFNANTPSGINDPEANGDLTSQQLERYTNLSTPRVMLRPDRNSHVRVKHSIINWLLQKGDKTVYINSHKMSADGINENTTYEELNRFLDVTVNPMPQYKLNIVQITRHLRIFDRCDSVFTDYERFHSVETVMTTDRYHKIRIYKTTDGTILYLTNNWEPSNLFQLIGLLPIFYTDFIEEDKKEALEPLFEAFYELNLSPILPTLLADLSNLEERLREEGLKNLQKAINSNATKQLKNNKRNLINTRSRQDSLLQQAAELADQCREYLRLIAAAELIPETRDDGTKAFLQKTNTVQLLYCDEYKASFLFTTPITNYVQKDVGMYFKRAEDNALNNPAWLADLIKDTFLEQKYQLITKTVIDVTWDNADYRCYRNKDNEFGNPHHIHFNCFSETRYAANQCIQDGEVLQALNILLASCATITFTDTAVTRRLAGDIIDTSHNEAFIKDLTTGELISPRQYRITWEENNA